MTELNEHITHVVEKTLLVDTHEHIMPESERNQYAVDFGYLFAHYNTSDLVSAGMPLPLMEAVRLPMHFYRQAHSKRMKLRRLPSLPDRYDMSLEERWKALAPYWEAIKNTAYARQTLIVMRDIFGFDDLTDETYAPLSKAIAASKRPGWYRHILKEKAGIALSVLDAQIPDADRDFFAPVMRLDHFVAPQKRGDIAALEQESEIAIHSLNDLVEAMQRTLEVYLKFGIIGIKSGLAYERTLKYDKVTHQEAERVFNRIANHMGEGNSWLEAKPLQDYMMHQVIRAAIEAKLPIQLHTGLQEGNANLIINSNPTLLVNLFLEYPEARFDLFHGGYPYVHEWVTLAKNFANVYADLTWLHIISPMMGRLLLHELIETVPGNKIFAYGGDSMTVEGAYGHARMARQVVARVLSEKVSEGYLTEHEAISLAVKILRDNPAEFYRLAIS